MKSVNGRIIVRVNMEQKDSMVIDGVVLSTAIKFEVNYREKSPVIAEVVEGNNFLKTGDIIICHHNHFYSPSPYFLYDDLFSIPFSKTIFAKVNKKGNLKAICSNIFGTRVEKKSEFEVPVEFREKYVDRIVVADNGGTSFKNGNTIFCRPNAPYDIVYNWAGEERRITKVSLDMVCGLLG